MKKAVALKPAKSRKQAAEITAEYLESEAHCVADLPDEGSHHDLFQLGEDFYLVETLLFLDGKRCFENPCALLPLQGNSKAAIAMRGKRITDTKTVAKLTPEGAMHWYILNVAPEVFRKDLAGNVPVKTCNGADWIEALAASEPGPIEKTIKLTLRAEDWATLAQGASVNGWSLDETMNFLFATHVDVSEWFNQGFDATTWAEGEKARMEALDKIQCEMAKEALQEAK